MVEKMVLMARALGIPTIAGDHYFADFERDGDRWRSVKDDKSQNRYLKMFEEVRNVAYAITPSGSLGPAWGRAREGDTAGERCLRSKRGQPPTMPTPAPTPGLPTRGVAAARWQRAASAASNPPPPSRPVDVLPPPPQWPPSAQPGPIAKAKPPPPACPKAAPPVCKAPTPPPRRKGREPVLKSGPYDWSGVGKATPPTLLR